MIEQMIRREQVIRLAAGGGLMLVYLGLLGIVLAAVVTGIASDPAQVLVLFLVYGSPVLVVALILLVRALRHHLNPGRHRLYQMLAPFGPPEEVLRRIDAELADLSDAFVRGRLPGWLRGQPHCVVLTANWLVRLSPKGSQVVRVPELTWVFKQATVGQGSFGKENFFFDIRGHLRDQPAETLYLDDEEDTDQLLQAIVEHRPELLTGFRAEWIALAKEGRVALAEAVERRRREFDALSDEAQQNWLEARLDELEDFVRRIDLVTPEARK